MRRERKNFRLSGESLRRLEEVCAAQGCTQTDVVERALELYASIHASEAAGAGRPETSLVRIQGLAAQIQQLCSASGA